MRSFNEGSVVSRFTLREKRVLAEYHATGYWFVHQSGMQVCFVENDDPEQFFSFVFRTIPDGDYGTPHILEHSTLSGSAKYPVHDPFMALDKASVNTYLNAMTYPDKTLYLASSPLAKDFKGIFDVYADAVFKPLLRKEAFEQEGVRLAGDHWEGVVFNEMQGDLSDPDGILARGVAKALFPDTAYAFESGGVPTSIVDLTYEAYKNFYRTHYQSANARLFVYGKNDMEAMLRQLDEEYLGQREAGAELPPVPRSVSWKPASRLVLPAPKGDGAVKDGTSILLCWATTPSSDPLEQTTLDILVDMLLDDPSCPLYQKLLDSGLGEDVSQESGYVADYRDLVFMAGFKGIEPGKADEAEAAILKALREIVDEGIGPDAIRSSIKRSRFKQQEITGSIPQGIRLLSRSLHGWMDGKGPFDTIEAGSVLTRLEEKLKEDPLYFEHWIKKHLLDNPHRALVSVVPDEQYMSGQTAILKEKAGRAWSTQREDDLAAFQRYENTPDKGEDLARLPHLSLGDLPVSVKKDAYEKTSLSGVPVIWRRQPSGGIEYLTLAVDENDLALEDFRAQLLYARLAGMTGLEDMDSRKVSLEMKRIFGNFDMTPDVSLDVKSGEPRSWMLVRMSFLKEDRKEALDFASRLLQHAKVMDADRIKVALTDLKGDFSDSITYSAHAFALLSAEGECNKAARDAEEGAGITQWRWLAAQKDITRLAGLMERLQGLLSQRGRLVAVLTGEDPSLKDDVAVFLRSFPEGRSREAGRTYPLLGNEGHARKAYALPGGVSYQSVVTDSSDPQSREQVAEALLGRMLTGGELWNRIRMKGGAYGVRASSDLMERLFLFTTYRDPRINGSVKDFKEALAHYTKKAPESVELEQAKISYAAGELKPKGPSQDSLIAFRRLLYGVDDVLRESRWQAMLALQPEELQKAAGRVLDSLSRRSAQVVLASREQLGKELADVEPLALPK